MIENEILEDEYRRKHREKHIPVGFIARLDIISDKIEQSMQAEDLQQADYYIETGIEMIKNEINDAYCKSILAAFLIDSTEYRFDISSVDKAYDIFGSGWDVLVKEGDTILLNSWAYWCNKIVAFRSLYAEHSQGDT